MISFKTYSTVLLCLSIASITALAEDVLLNQFTRLANGAVQLKAGGREDQVCSLLVSRNLETWRTHDFTNPAGVEATFLDNSAALETNRFYRAQLDTPVPDISTVTYHGWANSILMRNSQVEVAIVPTIGRIMQFRFRDQTDGPFWENTNMNGLQPSATSWNTPGSFGGDKVWPSPQTWPWPPPRGFDSMNYTATITNGIVTMTGPVDTTFGTRVVRRISLHPTEAILRVSTTFEKVSGTNRRIGVWVVTQLKDAERVFMPVPTNTVFPTGYVALGTVPPGLTSSNNLISFVRSPTTSAKVGNDAGALLWVGAGSALLIESPRIPGVVRANYPDSGSSAEIYTNPNPAAYIELELLAPMITLATNDTSEATCVYSLFRRTQPTAGEEARKIFAP